MVTLSEHDKFLIGEIVDFIANNPTREATNKKLVIALCEHLVNMTYPPKESQGQFNLCRNTKVLVFPFTNRETSERTFLCTKCRTFHTQQQTKAILETLDDEDSSNSTGVGKPPDEDN